MDFLLSGFVGFQQAVDKAGEIKSPIFYSSARAHFNITAPAFRPSATVITICGKMDNLIPTSQNFRGLFLQGARQESCIQPFSRYCLPIKTDWKINPRHPRLILLLFIYLNKGILSIYSDDTHSPL
ncbi:MAG: hypothetical protein MUO88_13870 [Desulfobacterales bacterium]|nr:hypothetical protein [Desulfobacterales bacterium]